MSFENVKHDDIWRTRDDAAQQIEVAISCLNVDGEDRDAYLHLKQALRDLYRYGPSPSFEAEHVP